MDSTIISGGYIKTTLLDANTIVTGTLITGTMGFGTTGKIYFGNSGSYINGGPDFVALRNSTSAWVILQGSMVTIGSYDTIGVSAGTALNLGGASAITLTAGSSNNIYFKFGSSTSAYMNAWGLVPQTSNNMGLGSSSQYWQACYATAFYDNGGGYNDDQDDLDVLHSMKPVVSDGVEVKDDYGLMVLDVDTLPDYMTNKVPLKQELSVEFNEGAELSDEEFENLMLLPHIKARLKRNLMRFMDIGVGAVRQLDIENSNLIEQLGDWVSSIELRLQAIENN